MPFFHRTFLLFFIFLSTSSVLNARETIKSLSLSIQEQSSDPGEQSQLLFRWISSHIKYDFKESRERNGYSIEENATRTLRRKKGICEDYVDLYCAVADDLELTVLKVRGFCRQKGVPDDLHTWLVVYVGDRWRLVDPTWGAGFQTDKGYVSQLNESYYDISPDSLIRTHYPFDPIYQLLKNPYSLEDFKLQGSKERKLGNPINFNDSLIEYNFASDIERLQGEIERMKTAGINHPLVKAQFLMLQRNLEIELYNKRVNIFNLAVDYFNEGQSLYSKMHSDTLYALKQSIFDHLNMSLRLLKRIDNQEKSFQKEMLNMQQVITRQLEHLQRSYPPLENGDLIFVEMCRSDFSDAIVAVTKSSDAYQFSHVGIVERNETGVFVIEAIGKGVVATPIEEFWESPSYFRFRVARLKENYQKYIPEAIVEARRHLGKGYDWPFDFENDRYYCSELVYVALAKASGDKDFFPVIPMTFIDPRLEKFSPNWVRYFARLQYPIPEGKPGVTPGGLSLSEKIYWLD